MDGRFVAIKMHFGEMGNLAYLRPNYAKVVADLCKEQGGLPFLTDCNTLYPGSRKNALEHLTCAQENGFWPMTTGCQILIGDGLRGTDEVEVPVPNGEYCKTAKIGRAIMDADIFISLTHFKGHESTGPLRQGVRLGRYPLQRAEQGRHRPGQVQGLRPLHRCACNFDAIYSQCDSANEMLDRKMAEYAAAVCHGRPTFHISLVQDVSPNCDCHGENDAPILPDIGMFASTGLGVLNGVGAHGLVAACLAQPSPAAMTSQLGPKRRGAQPTGRGQRQLRCSGWRRWSRRKTVLVRFGVSLPVSACAVEAGMLSAEKSSAGIDPPERMRPACCQKPGASGPAHQQGQDDVQSKRPRLFGASVPGGRGPGRHPDASRK